MNKCLLIVFLISSLEPLSCFGFDRAPRIVTPNGPIDGSITEYRGVNVLSYKGIPYARPPVGEYRFLPPIRPDKWSVPIDGSQYGPKCVQPSQDQPQSEDCLFLNVFVPQKSFLKKKSLPVMVYIHYGYFLLFSGDMTYYSANPIVAYHDIVLVSFNYRLGIFGFLYAGNNVSNIKSNLGFRDQILALEWVKENIHLFGGDPSRVTIFGNSAGSQSVGLHLLSKSSGNLFKNAIMQSGVPLYSEKQRNILIRKSQDVIRNLDCWGENILGCMQRIETQRLLNESSAIISGNIWAFNPFQPIIGDDVLPLTTIQALKTRNFNIDKNLLAGTEKNDIAYILNTNYPPFDWLKNPNYPPTYANASAAVRFLIENQTSAEFFIHTYLDPYKNGTANQIKIASLELADDIYFQCSTYLFSSLVSDASGENSSVFNYLHTTKPKSSYCPDDPEEIGPCHTDELQYVFGSPLLRPEKFNRTDDELSIRIMQIWTHFAKNGKLPSQGPVDWPSLGQRGNKNNQVMELNVQKIGHLHREKFKFCLDNWQHFIQYYDPNAVLGYNYRKLRF